MTRCEIIANQSVQDEIISLMGTGANWSYGVTGIYWRGSSANFFM